MLMSGKYGYCSSNGNYIYYIEKIELEWKRSWLTQWVSLLMSMIIVYGREWADVIIPCDSPDFENMIWDFGFRFWNPEII
jgi:hypothetical protein